MRVISGSARSLILKTPKGDATRPTTDKIKETLFNMIANELYGVRFLDLFAGSGAIGIEALSRGAGEAVFVDISRDAIECVKENLIHTKLNNKAAVIRGNYNSALKSLEGQGKKFDMVFLDPPYNKGIEDKCLELLDDYALIDSTTLIIIEEDIATDISHLEEKWCIDKIKLYKSNKHIFLHKRGSDG